MTPLMVHVAAEPGGDADSHQVATWEEAHDVLAAAYEGAELLAWVIEWTDGAGPRICFEWMHRDIWHAHGGMGPGRLRGYVECFSQPQWEPA